MKLMSKSLEKKFEKYPLYSQDGKGGDAEVVVKYFNPSGVGTWLITEASKEEDGDWTMFGYCHLGDDELAELGYIMLSDLERIKVPPFGLGIERDKYMPDGLTLIEAMERDGIKPPSWMLEDMEEEQEHSQDMGMTL